MNNYWPLDKLHNWENNPRTITKEGLERLKKQLEKHGQYKPLIVTQDGTVIGGNMRLKAMQEMGVKEAWVSVVDAETEEKKIEIALSDNDRVGRYDEDQLANLTGNFPNVEWKDYSVDLKDPINLGELIDRFTPIEEDEPPEVDETETISKLGEVYQLGRHRLMCGDSTKIEDVEKLMNGQKADMVFTDPPYNTGMDKKHDATWLHHMFHDNFTPEQFEALITNSLANMYAVTKGSAAFYVCIDWRNVGYIKTKVEEIIPVHNVIVWDKVVHGLGSDYKFTYEQIVVGKKGKPRIENRIGEDYRDIWHVQRKVGFNEDHATAKPIELCQKPILHASKEDDTVLDLFGGSGSTLIACEQTNRICYTMELDPKYCDVIRKRYANFIGKEEQWQEITKPVDQR